MTTFKTAKEKGEAFERELKALLKKYEAEIIVEADWENDDIPSMNIPEAMFIHFAKIGNQFYGEYRLGTYIGGE